MRVVSTLTKLLSKPRNGKIANAAVAMSPFSSLLLSQLCGTLPAWLSCWTPELLDLWLLSGPSPSLISLVSDFGGQLPPAAGIACLSAVICADAAAEPSSVSSPLPSPASD